MFTTTSFKESAIRAIQHLPEESDFDDLIERLYVLHWIHRGIAQDEAGEAVSQDQIEGEFLE